MSKKPKKDLSLLDLLNLQGFLFQLRIGDEIAQTENEHKWRVGPREYRWEDSESGLTGYTDLILERDNGYKVVIECKRSLDAKWVFLVPGIDMKPVDRSCLLWSERREVYPKVLVGWSDILTAPSSLESAFCMGLTQDNSKEEMTLEKMCGTLLQSLEAVAVSELSLSSWRKNEVRIYIPVIVTTARLIACRFETSKVDLQTGQLDSADFQDVPYIRFRKSFPSNMPSGIPSDPSIPASLTEANLKQERTVFLVQATQLVNFLRGWNVWRLGDSEHPWDTIRRRYY